MRPAPGVPAMGEQHGRPSGADSAESLELDAAREEWQHKRALADDLWTAYQCAEVARARWQEAEVDAITAGKRYADALRAAAGAVAITASEGERGS